KSHKIKWSTPSLEGKNVLLVIAGACLMLGSWLVFRLTLKDNPLLKAADFVGIGLCCIGPFLLGLGNPLSQETRGVVITQIGALIQGCGYFLALRSGLRFKKGRINAHQADRALDASSNLVLPAIITITLGLSSSVFALLP